MKHAIKTHVFRLDRRGNHAINPQSDAIKGALGAMDAMEEKEPEKRVVLPFDIP